VLPLDDPRWADLIGGYRVAYDARPLVKKFIDRGVDRSTWKEIWDNLHHQGDIDTASYAVLPYLVSVAAAPLKRDAELYAYCATLCFEEHNGRNPPVPQFLQLSYAKALEKLFEMAIADLRADAPPGTVRYILSFLAAYRGAPDLGRAIRDIGWFEDFGERVLEAERNGRN
jgi:hypothetical protein